MVHTISGNQLHPHRRRRSTPARAPQWWQSQESVTATWIRFHNTSKSHTVRLFWYDYDGLLRPYKEIAPGGSCRQQTYLTHPWTFKVRPMRQTPPPPLTVQQQAEDEANQRRLIAADVEEEIVAAAAGGRLQQPLRNALLIWAAAAARHACNACATY